MTVGNALNGSTFRGSARGFQLEALLKVCLSEFLTLHVPKMLSQLKETKTARGASDCPTLLHYLAKVLMKADPSLATFIEEMLHVEAAARGEFQMAFISYE